MKKQVFTPQQQDFIRAHYLLKSSNDIGRQVKSSGQLVRNFLKENNLVVPYEVSRSFAIEKQTGKTNFTPVEDAEILKYYLTLPIKTLGIQMGRSYTGIMSRLKQMGITIPTEVIERNKAVGRIKVGNEPKNKGRKQTEYMSEAQIARTVGTRFKKGQIPHNAYDQDGIITTRHEHPDRNGGRPYKYIRLELGKWQPYHTYLWEQQNGPVPTGHCLWFKDGDSLNCQLDNLELITRGENYARNNGNRTLEDKAVARYLATSSKKVDKELQAELMKHPDLIELKRTELLLNRAIKQQEHGKR